MLFRSIPGYTDVESYWKVTRSDKTHAEVLSLISAMPLKFEPGSRYAYDNTGFYLLGLLIEKISGTSYGDFLEARIFKPLHMTSTQVNNYTRIIPHRSQGYIYQDGGLTNKDFYSTSNTFSAGILLSTIRDLARWHSALFDDSILNAHFRQLWWSPYPSAAGNERDTNYSVGLGWFIVDSPLGQFLGHNGGILGFVASFLYFPKTNISAFVLCNAGQVTEPHHIAFEVIRRISH